MPKLPTKDALGELPRITSIGTVSAGQADLSAAARGQRAIGAGLADLGAGFSAMAERSDQDQQYEVQRKLAEFRLDTDLELENAQRETMPQGGEGFTQQWQQQYATRAHEFFGKDGENIPPRYRARIDLALTEHEGATMRRAQHYELGERDRHIIDGTNQTLQRFTAAAAAAPDRLDLYIQEGEQLINSARLSPAARARALQQFRLDATQAAIESRINAGDADGELERLRQLPKGTQLPSPGGTTPAPSGADAPDFSGRPGPASLRFNNPGAMYPGPSARRFGSTGTETIGGGHKIAVFPDAVSGAAAQFDLLASRYAGMTLERAIERWSGGNSSEAYAASVAREAGISLGTKLTKELIQSPQGVVLARAMAKVEAGQTYPLSDQQWGEAQARAFGGGVRVAGGPQEVAQAETGTSTDAGPQGEGPRLPGETTGGESTSGSTWSFVDKPAYPYLTMQQRQTMIRNLQIGQRNRTGHALREDEQRLLRGEDVARDPEGRIVSMERARRIMTPNQIDFWSQRIDEAAIRRAAITELQHLPPAEAARRLRALPPLVRDKVEPLWGKITELYETDPAAAVSGTVMERANRVPSIHIGEDGTPTPVGEQETNFALPPSPDVARAYADVHKRNPDLSLGSDDEGNVDVQATTNPLQRAHAAQQFWQSIFEARLAAEAKRGVPEVSRRIITKAEAIDLLDMGRDPSTLPEAEFPRRLRLAADRAEARYGPAYARRAFEEAVRFVIRGREERQDAAGLIARLARGESVESLNTDLRRYGVMREINMAGRVFDPDPERPAIGRTPMSTRPLDRGDFNRVEGVNTQLPNDQHIDWAMEDPEVRQPVFDQKFGPGAYARSVAKRLGDGGGGRSNLGGPRDEAQSSGTPDVMDKRLRPPPLEPGGADDALGYIQIRRWQGASDEDILREMWPVDGRPPPGFSMPPRD